jgi:hypothetical protein
VKADYIVHWPGQDVFACNDHRGKLAGVAAAMGFSISCSAIFSEAPECTNCANEAKKRSSNG